MEMKNSRYECIICHGICDPGELRNGKCFDCALKEKAQQHNVNIVPPGDYAQMGFKDVGFTQTPFSDPDHE